MEEIRVVYINDQEPWWGNYNPCLPNGCDTTGDGTWERPFKTVQRAINELKARGHYGHVRDMHSALRGYYDREKEDKVLQLELASIRKELSAIKALPLKEKLDKTKIEIINTIDLLRRRRRGYPYQQDTEVEEQIKRLLDIVN